MEARTLLTRARLSSPTSLSVLAGVVVQALAVFTGPILARGLGAEGRGAVAAVVAPVVTVSALVSFGLNQSASRLGLEGSSTSSRESRLTAILSLGAAASFLAILLAWSVVQPRHGHEWLLIASIPAQYAAGLTLSFSLGAGVTKTYTALRILPFLMFAAAVTILFVLGRLSVALVVIAQAASFLVWAFAVLPSAISNLKRCSGQLLVATARASTAFSVAGLSVVAFAGLDQLVLALIASSSELGHYVVAFSYAGLLEVAIAGINVAAFQRMGESDHADRALRRTLTASLIGSTFLAASAPFVIPLAFGPDFEPAVMIVWVLLPGRILHDLSTSYFWHAVATQRPRRLARAGPATFLLVAICVFAGYRLGGSIGAAVGVTVAQAARLVVLRTLRQST